MRTDGQSMMPSRSFVYRPSPGWPGSANGGRRPGEGRWLLLPPLPSLFPWPASHCPGCRYKRGLFRRPTYSRASRRTSARAGSRCRPRSCGDPRWGSIRTQSPVRTWKFVFSYAGFHVKRRPCQRFFLGELPGSTHSCSTATSRSGCRSGVKEALSPGCRDGIGRPIRCGRFSQGSSVGRFVAAAPS